MKKNLHADAELIRRMGGPSKVAKICGISQPSVSGWKKRGIPPARLQFFRLYCPDLFEAEGDSPAPKEVA